MFQQYTPYFFHIQTILFQAFFWIVTWECFLSICQYLFNTCVSVSKLTLYFCILCTTMLLYFIHFVNMASFGSYLYSPLPWCWRFLVATLASIWCTYFRVMFLTRSGDRRTRVTSNDIKINISPFRRMFWLELPSRCKILELFFPVYSDFITFNWSTLGAVYIFYWNLSAWTCVRPKLK